MKQRQSMSPLNIQNLILLSFLLISCNGTTAEQAADGGKNPTSATPPAGPANRDGATRTVITGVWVPRTASVLYSGDATGNPIEQKISLAPPIQDLYLDRGSFEQLTEITTTELSTYTYFIGESVYFKLTRPLSCVETDACWLLGDPAVEIYSSATDFNFVNTFQLTEGQLTQLIIMPALRGTSHTSRPTIYTTVTYDAYAGNFPPSNWPSTRVEVTQ